MVMIVSEDPSTFPLIAMISVRARLNAATKIIEFVGMLCLFFFPNHSGMFFSLAMESNVMEEPRNPVWTMRIIATTSRASAT